MKSILSNGRYINIYSKKYKRGSPIQAISKTACEDHFYEIPEKFIINLNKEVFDSNFFEKDFFAENIESLYTPILESINQLANDWKKNKNLNEVIILPPPYFANNQYLNIQILEALAYDMSSTEKVLDAEETISFQPWCQ